MDNACKGKEGETVKNKEDISFNELALPSDKLCTSKRRKQKTWRKFHVGKKYEVKTEYITKKYDKAYYRYGA